MIYSTNNKIVDSLMELNISGNVIPHSWYSTIIRDNGKPYLNAIIILSDIVYWYRPSEIRDEYTGGVTGIKKRFRGNYLQRNYQQLADQFGISKKEARSALQKLEAIGVIRRHLSSVASGNGVLSNVLYIELVPGVLQQLTYPETYPDKAKESFSETYTTKRVQMKGFTILPVEKQEENLPPVPEKTQGKELAPVLEKIGGKDFTSIPKRIQVKRPYPIMEERQVKEYSPVKKPALPPQKDTGVSPKGHTYTEITTEITKKDIVCKKDINIKGEPGVSQQEYQELVEEFGEGFVKEKIARAKKYKNCNNYGTIYRWCKEDLKACESFPSPPQKSSGEGLKNKFNNFHQRSYDYAELEKQLLTKDTNPDKKRRKYYGNEQINTDGEAGTGS